MVLAKKVNFTQSEFNDYVNARLELFRLENMLINRSHADEIPGNDDIERIIKDMTNFKNGGR
ncbi:hypothetical protein FHQ28_08805 [Pasteurellaceae bacterium USgator11]|nr:hypothetical protein FHQ20_12875 [Pasteurellaceae bacterium USgator41]TNG91324.1 hypothetical protein FHQ19_12655 [Pasteurellaceae bacterium UScroc12]TNH00021.1 hypothetical protein FHQ28_08805 [Pasteurellaceae bacterium USgator11]